MLTMIKRPLSTLPPMARRFARSEDGAVAPILGLMMIALIGCVGLGIDVGRSVLVRAKLNDALDAAGLAVGARISTSDFSADAKKFVAANFAANYANATVTNVTASANSTNSVITLTATATMPTSFMKIFGQNLVTVTTTSEITRSTTGLELVLALDNTGSMAGSIPALKTAANDLVDIVFGSDTTASDLFVGLVPFSDTVNIGTTRSTWVNFVNNQKKNWKGCVMAREDGQDQTDTPPSSTTTKFDDYYYPSKGGAFNCPKEITPMTNVKSTVTTGINAMTSDGNTHINLGAAWAWSLISPKWRNYWGTLAWKGTILPLDYNTDKMSKAVVLMTDGDNTMSSTVYTAYGWLTDGNLGTTNGAKAETELDNRLTTVCNSMKTNGIIVYTVAFNNPPSGTKTLLQNCATTTSYYFDAANEAALKSAFQVIGDSLSNLRVSR